MSFFLPLSIIYFSWFLLQGLRNSTGGNKRSERLIKFSQSSHWKKGKESGCAGTDSNKNQVTNVYVMVSPINIIYHGRKKMLPHFIPDEEPFSDLMNTHWCPLQSHFLEQKRWVEEYFYFQHQTFSVYLHIHNVVNMREQSC